MFHHKTAQRGFQESQTGGSKLSSCCVVISIFLSSIGSKQQKVSFCFSIFTTSGPVVSDCLPNTTLAITQPKQDHAFHLLSCIHLFPCQKMEPLFTQLVATTYRVNCSRQKKWMVILSFLYFLHLIFCTMVSTV